MLKILLADDDPPHLEDITDLICAVVRTMPASAGISEADLEMTTISQPSQVDEMVQRIRSGASVPYDIILADIFMPEDQRHLDKTSDRGGWLKFQQAIVERLDHAPDFMDERLLVAVTSRGPESGEIRQRITSLNKKAPWLLFMNKPATPAIGKLCSASSLIEQNTWGHFILDVLRNFKNRLWRETFVRGTLDRLAACSASFNALLAKVGHYANESVVLLTGESGSGKELIAKALHENSCRATNRFVPRNVAALSSAVLESELFGHEKNAFTGAAATKAGCFELAGNGTLFLDEFGSDPHQLELLDPKLRRVLDRERSFERLGGTTSLTFEGALIIGGSQILSHQRDGSLSEDLLARIESCHIHVPPLRERKDDIVPLAERFLQSASKEGNPAKKLSESAMRWMREYPWPGNVRQLEKAMERVVKDIVVSTDITENDVQSVLGSKLHDRIEDDANKPALTPEALLDQLKRANGFIDKQTAEFFRCDGETIRRKIKALQEKDEDFSKKVQETGFPRPKGSPPKRKDQ